MTMQYDAGGYATKNDLKCSDGRVIMKDAFKHQDGITVPLVWKHLHDAPSNVLGHALLENREDGVYAYLKFNNTEAGQNSKTLVEHRDITYLSIYANDLIEKSKSVLHGAIREVSLVMVGANPGARIDNLGIVHSDGEESTIAEDEAIIHTGIAISLPEKEEVKVPEKEVIKVPEKEAVKVPEKEAVKVPEVIAHADSENETVEQIFETLTDKQKEVVFAVVAEAINAAAAAGNVENSMSQSDKGDAKVMKNNVFDKGTSFTKEDERPSLSHSQFEEIVKDATKYGSFKESFLQHAASLGITDIDLLFPDAKSATSSPAMIQRKMAWVADVLNGAFHTPFSRIRSFAADITADDARARGYVKGNLKSEEIIRMLRRVTIPTTVYKKQKLDRDDVLDIVDLDIVAWLKAEMRVMLDEELARAILVGDGRATESPDKINEERIRPIYNDDDMYVERVQVAEDGDGEDIVEGIIRARHNYHGSGNPVMFVSPEALSDMLLVRDSTGRRLYSTKAELETALLVSKIVEVPVMSNVSRVTEDVPAVTLDLLAIILNTKDYTVGADKGGQVSMFDDFDIDYNQLKYLIETRISGALVLPKSAIVVEQVAPAG